MSMRTKLPCRAAAATMRSTFSRQKPASILSPSEVSLIETFDGRPRAAMASSMRIVLVGGGGRLGALRDLLAQQVQGRHRALGGELLHHGEGVLELLAGDVAARDPADDGLRDERQSLDDQPARRFPWRSEGAAPKRRPWSRAARSPRRRPSAPTSNRDRRRPPGAAAASSSAPRRRSSRRAPPPGGSRRSPGSRGSRDSRRAASSSGGCR